MTHLPDVPCYYCGAPPTAEADRQYAHWPQWLCGSLLIDKDDENGPQVERSRECLRREARLEVARLEDLLHHVWVHASYDMGGYKQMTTEERALFDHAVRQSQLRQGIITEEAIYDPA